MNPAVGQTTADGSGSPSTCVSATLPADRSDSPVASSARASTNAPSRPVGTSISSHSSTLENVPVVNDDDGSSSSSSNNTDDDDDDDDDDNRNNIGGRPSATPLHQALASPERKRQAGSPSKLAGAVRHFMANSKQRSDSKPTESPRGESRSRPRSRSGSGSSTGSLAVLAAAVLRSRSTSPASHGQRSSDSEVLSTGQLALGTGKSELEKAAAVDCRIESPHLSDSGSSNDSTGRGMAPRARVSTASAEEAALEIPLDEDYRYYEREQEEERVSGRARPNQDESNAGRSYHNGADAYDACHQINPLNRPLDQLVHRQHTNDAPSLGNISGTPLQANSFRRTIGDLMHIRTLKKKARQAKEQHRALRAAQASLREGDEGDPSSSAPEVAAAAAAAAAAAEAYREFSGLPLQPVSAQGGPVVGDGLSIERQVAGAWLNPSPSRQRRAGLYANSPASSRRRLDSLTADFRHTYDTIDDSARADVHEAAGDSNRPTCSLRAVGKFFLRIHYPFEPFAKAWDLLILVLLVYCMWEIPVRLGLMLDVAFASPFWIFSLCVDCIFILDCFFHLSCLAHVDKDGYVIDNRADIALHYLRGWFTIDFLSSLPLASFYEAALETVEENDSSILVLRLPSVLRAFRSIRLIKLLRSVRICSRSSGDAAWKESSNTFHGTLRMLRTFVVVLYVGHVAACVWAFVSLASADEYGNFPDSSWANDWLVPNVDYVDKLQLYFLSLYWSLETLSTVGYGDMLPTSTPELIWTAFVMLGGTCTFGYVIASLASLLTRADEEAELKRSEISKICTWMNHRELDSSLRERIRDHFEYKWRLSSIYDEAEILSSIPSFLRTEISLFMYRDVLRGVDFLHELGNKCLASLVTALQPIRASPGQAIVQMHQVGEEMYIVEGGICSVYFCELSRERQANQKYLADVKLKKNDYFAEYCILYDVPRSHPFSVQASTVVTLLSLSLDAYQQVLRAFPGVRAELEKGSVTKDLKETLDTFWKGGGKSHLAD